MSFDKKAWRKAYRDKAYAEGKCILCCKEYYTEGFKTCTSCREQHKLTLKKRVLRSKQGGLCIMCHSNPSREGKQTCEVCSDKNSKNSKLRLYKLTDEQYQQLMANPRCAICGSYDNIHIDHCHSTGEVRGLLCISCNHGLGMFKDNVHYLISAIEYLKK